MIMTIKVFCSRKIYFYVEMFFLSFFYVVTTEAVTGRVLQKKVFLIISYYSQENTVVRDSNTRDFL